MAYKLTVYWCVIRSRNMVLHFMIRTRFFKRHDDELRCQESAKKKDVIAYGITQLSKHILAIHSVSVLVSDIPPFKFEKR